jgi:hypothetical protein
MGKSAAIFFSSISLRKTAICGGNKFCLADYAQMLQTFAQIYQCRLSN